ncbi:MAG: UDP-N-acetylglucosamine 2-epimerase (non-hydrolyzing) [Candidatus Bathyarchaeota archaeon]|nr:MAG: UDP-N-acetylglucosamine 2-epimerase (non-hydrolyzing) [Candidatus Bathyarchaeota archaeon]
MICMRQLKVLGPEELRDKVCIIVGTRPGIIKFSPIIREIEKRNMPSFIIHTGQHYSYNMDKLFFDELSLPQPKHRVPNVSSARYHGKQTAKMLEGIEAALLKEKPRLVLVGGDANTNLAGALAARKLHICVGHIEAGLRSGDWRMPEEHNRVMIDHISDLLFAPTEESKRNLVEEKVEGKRFVTGNTIVDAIEQNVVIAKAKSKIKEELGLKRGNYFLLTLHREENIDFKENLVDILKGIKMVAKVSNFGIIFPIHPRTKKRLRYFKLNSLVNSIKKLKIIDPTGYLDFLALLESSSLVLTDSGGIQEESCILRIPCVTLRESTERPETVKVGSNAVAGTKPKTIMNNVKTMVNVNRSWKNPFGEDASRKIVDIIEKELAL